MQLPFEQRILFKLLILLHIFLPQHKNQYWIIFLLALFTLGGTNSYRPLGSKWDSRELKDLFRMFLYPELDQTPWLK